MDTHNTEKRNGGTTMSSDEQDAAILRLVKQRGEAKKRRALLQNELRTAGQSLWEIGGALRNITPSGTFHETPGAVIPQIDKAPDICGLAQIRAMLAELKDVEKTIHELNRRASEL